MINRYRQKYNVYVPGHTAKPNIYPSDQILNVKAMKKVNEKRDMVNVYTNKFVS